MDPEEDVIEKAVTVIREGGVVAHPTDTCYGFAVDAFNEEAIKKLYELKKMDLVKPVSVIVSDETIIEEVVDINDKARELMDEYFPGALTVIMKKNDGCPAFLNPSNETLGVRIPDCKVSMALCDLFDGFLTSTSANITTMPQAYSIDDIVGQFEDEELQPDLILDGGLIEEKAPSTVVDVSEGGIKVVRQGEIKL